MICRLMTEKDDGRPLRDYLKGELGLSRHCLSLLKKREDGILLNGVRVTVRATNGISEARIFEVRVYA